MICRSCHHPMSRVGPIIICSHCDLIALPPRTPIIADPRFLVSLQSVIESAVLRQAGAA